MVLDTVALVAKCEFTTALHLPSAGQSHTHTHSRKHSSQFMASVIKLIPCYEFPDPLNLSAHIKCWLFWFFLPAAKEEMDKRGDPREGRV